MSQFTSAVVASEKSIQELEEIVNSLRIHLSEERADLLEDTNKFQRLYEEQRRCDLHHTMPRLLPNDDLMRLQELILEAQDTIMDYDCEMKVMRKMVKRNAKLMAPYLRHVQDAMQHLSISAGG